MENVTGSVTGITRICSNKEKCVLKKIYECTNYKKYGKSRCSCHNISEDLLFANFKQFLILLKNNYEEEILKLKLEENKKGKKDNLEELKINLENLETEYKILLSEKIKELSSCKKEKRNFLENTYKSLEDEKYKQIQTVKNEIENMNKNSSKLKEEKIKQAIDYFNQIIESENIDKTVLDMLIDKIYIYHDKSVKFKLKIDIDKLIK